MRKIAPTMRASVLRCELQDYSAKDFKGHLVLVQFEHDNGVLMYDDAFIADDPVDSLYVWVMTEHRGYHVFPRDELLSCVEYERVKTTRTTGFSDD